MKTCQQCKQSKPATDFCCDKRRPDGRSVYCRECTKIIRQATKQRRMAKPKPVVPNKPCHRCQATKAAGEFYKNRATCDGLSAFCRACTKAHEATMYTKHRDKKKAAVAAYKKAHRGRYNELNRQAYHRDVAHAKQLAKRKRQTPQWRRRNANYQLQRRSRKLANGPVENVDRLKVYARDGGICHICRRPVPLEDLHVDHVIPIVRGGLHTYDNCKTAHSGCNIRKRDKLMEELV